jgi:hypothetical protein
MTFKKQITALLLTLLVCLSCNDSKTSNAQEATTTTTLGTKHFLENDGIRIELPEDYKRYSSAKYEALLKDLLKGKALELEQQRLKHLRKIEGNNYIYFNENTKSTILINTVEPKPMLKEDATAILSDIVRDQAEISSITKQEFSKISANYSPGITANIFKSIFKVTEKKTKNAVQFQHKYYISTKDRYVIIDINTPSELDFDPYLETIRL